MIMEIYLHAMVLDGFLRGEAVNVRVNYPDQYDIKLSINPKKYIIIFNGSSSNIITIRKKKLLDYLKFKRNR